MIRRLLTQAAAAAMTAVEQVWGWRSYGFGPPTQEYQHTVFGGTAVRWEQAGAVLRWDAEPDGLQLEAAIGPLQWWARIDGLDLSTGLPGIELSRTVTVKDHTTGAAADVSVYWVPGNLGGLVEVGRKSARLTLGPLGVMIEKVREVTG